MLFSYYAVLNAGILGIAWFKAWRILNLVGFAFTFVIGALWGVQLLPAGALREHRAVPRPLLPLLRRDPAPLRAPPGGQAGALRRCDARLRRAARRVRPAGGARARHRIRRGVERARAGRALPRAREGRLGPRGRAAPAPRRELPRARRRVRDARDPARARGAVDLGGVGARGRGDRLGRRAAAAARGALLRARAAVPRRARVPGRYEPGRPARSRSRTASISAACSSRSAGCSARGTSTATARRSPAASGSPRTSCSAGASCGGWSAACTRSATTSAYAYRAQAALLFFTGSCVAFSWLHTRLDWRAARYVGARPAPAHDRSRRCRGRRLRASARAHRLDRVAARVRRALPRAPAPRDAGEPLPVLAARRRPLAVRRARELGGRPGRSTSSWGARRCGRSSPGRSCPGALLALLALRGTRIGWPVAAHRDAYLVAGARRSPSSSRCGRSW